ncbi:hypothetical protein BV898_15597 [Hypsibius exemplaris]|uniref:Transmembrane protein n=1 Tax=Hypsibius exemplaris TaxID=2072580 RepID=A0A9X6NEA6_HYPEX|nr:hypothetical protein BV898_15597 [Hypsibius exemplaris]
MVAINRFRSPAVLMVLLLLLVDVPFKPVARSSSLTEEQQTDAGCSSVGFCSLRKPATQGGTCTKTPWQLNNDHNGLNHFKVCNLVETDNPTRFDGLCQPGCKFHYRKAGWAKAEQVDGNGLGIVNVVPSEDGDPVQQEHLYWHEFKYDTYISCCRTSGGGADDCTMELCYYFQEATDHEGKSSKNPEKPATVLPETTEPNWEPTGRNDGDGEGRVSPAVSVKPSVPPQSAVTCLWYAIPILLIVGAAVIAGIWRVCFRGNAGNATRHPQENPQELQRMSNGAGDHPDHSTITPLLPTTEPQQSEEQPK